MKLADPSAQVQTAQPPDLTHPALGEPVRGDGRGYAVGLGVLEDRAGGLEDAGGALLGALEVLGG